MKSGGPAVSLNVMVVLLLLLLYFYNLTYLSLNSDWLKSLKKQAKIADFEHLKLCCLFIEV